MAEKIRHVSFLILDVDGVMTDGRIIIDDAGNETKQFHVRDGHGLKLLMRVGIEVIVITGRTSEVVEHRARELGIHEVHQGSKDKVAVLEEIMARRNITGENIAYMGDDIVDVPVFRKVGFAVAVADASDDAREAADYITGNSGGNGAVREICELILKVQNKWDTVVSRYYSD
ncbi:MAG: HAD-IIIA family hydrolase [Deltaproteobacteria bacterium]|nr:HAD-IIIA family hydrolase [Deltaproteobacteria bacterium]MBN2687718.1 HAD-IIIA family hydrolase [Deltaproteobacteria bacterium]